MNSGIKRIGFTGTKCGMRTMQAECIRDLLRRYYYPGNEFHHGDCKGADIEAAKIADNLGYIIVCHPPINPMYRGYFPLNDRILTEEKYTLRDHNIVDSTHFMLAAPHTLYEITRSGTWMTVRYARKQNRDIHVVSPQGIDSWERSSALKLPVQNLS